MEPGIIGILVGLTIFITVYAIWTPPKEAAKNPVSIRSMFGEEEEKSEELTSFDKYIRPSLLNFLPQAPFAHNMRDETKDRITALLIQSGNPFKLTPEQYVGLSWLGALAGMVVGIIVGIASPVEYLSFYLTVPLFAVMAYFLPHMIHTSRRDQKTNIIQKELPEALDLLVVTMNAGNTFNGSLESVSDRLPEGGIIKDELRRVSDEIKSGVRPSKALTNFSYRTASEDVSSFVGAVLQSEKTGASPTDTLQAQAVFARQSYEARLERKSARLSTTMFIPLILTMLPAMMLIFLAPPLMQLGGVF